MGRMARKPDKLTVSYTPKAEATLDDNWEWNAHQFDRDHVMR